MVRDRWATWIMVRGEDGDGGSLLRWMVGFSDLAVGSRVMIVLVGVSKRKRV